MADPQESELAEQIHPLRIFAGVIVILLLVVAVVWAFVDDSLQPFQFDVLRMLMAICTGILFLVIGGAITLKSGGMAATGGIAVWFAFAWVYPSMKPKDQLTIYFIENGVALKGHVPIEIRFADEKENDEATGDGEARFTVPSGLSQIDSIHLGDGTKYRPVESGPYEITPGKALTIEVEEVEPTPIDGPQDRPNHPNEKTDIPGLPSKEEVLSAKASFKPEEVGYRLEYLNETDQDLTLWLFNSWTHYTGKRGAWREFPFPRMKAPEVNEEFHSQKDGNGYYSILVETATGEFNYLGSEILFRDRTTRLVVSKAGEALMMRLE